MGLLDAPSLSATPRSREALRTSGSTAMRPWFAALANRDNARATIVCIGDSVTEGIGATTLSTRWIPQLARLLRARDPLATPVVGGDGYYAAWLGASVPTGPWSTTGAPVSGSTFGLGRRHIEFTAAGTASVTFTGTDAVLFYAKGNNLAGAFGYTVDGGASIPISWSGAIQSGQTINITGLTAGSHTIVITWASGDVHINGLWVFNGDYAKGIHVIDSGHAGNAVSNFSVNTFWLRDINVVAPACITIELGINDQRLSGVSSATFKTNLLAFIAQIKANVTASRYTIVLVAAYQPTGSFTEPWANYVTAMREIADADASVVLLDLGLRMEAAVVANLDGLYSADLIHPSNKGHGFIANSLAKFLEPV